MEMDLGEHISTGCEPCFVFRQLNITFKKDQNKCQRQSSQLLYDEKNSP